MKKVSSLLAIGATVVLSAGIANATVIGFDENGTSSYHQIDSIVWNTDTGLSRGFIPPNYNPQTPYLTDFWLQASAATLKLNGQQQGPNFSGIALGNKELTFVTHFKETVIGEGVDVNGNPYVTFASGERPDSTFELWLDSNILTGSPTGTHSDPNVVSGYNDGIKILTGHLSNVAPSKFTGSTTTGGVGTGSFDVSFKIDEYNGDYIKLYDNILNFRFHSTGTLNQPGYYHPTAMWDGTSTTGGDNNPQVFKFDGSTDFTAVPEPSTFLLLGAGLLGAGIITRKKRA